MAKKQDLTERSTHSDRDFLGLDKLVAYLVAASGSTPAAISRKIGKSKGYVGAILSKGNIPGVGVLADIAEACGYGIAIVGRDDALLVESEHTLLSELDTDYGSYALDCELQNSGRHVVSVLDHYDDSEMP